MELIDNLEYKIDDIAEAIKYKTDIDEDWKIAEMARLIRAINNGNGNPVMSLNNMVHASVNKGSSTKILTSVSSVKKEG